MSLKALNGSRKEERTKKRYHRQHNHARCSLYGKAELSAARARRVADMKMSDGVKVTPYAGRHCGAFHIGKGAG